MTENIDLAPTFEQLAGITPPTDVDGRSLVPVLHGQTPPNWRTAALVEHHKPTAHTVGPDNDSGNFGADPPSYEALRTGGYMYAEYADGEKEFYDLQRDPNELDNLAAQLSPATSAALHHDLVALEHCHGAKGCAAADHPAPPPGVSFAG